MKLRHCFGFVSIIFAVLIVTTLWPYPVSARAGADRFLRTSFLQQQDDGSDKSRRKRKTKEKPASSRNIRWGQRRKETDKKYDRRYRQRMAKIALDGPDDASGGPTRLWTYHNERFPFIVRSDISQEFTADTVMYMELLHREYATFYRMLIGKPSFIKEMVEVVVFKDRKTYQQHGGKPGSGGMFATARPRFGDRAPDWPAPHYRLVMFTNDIIDFAKWEKDTLRHEAAHMETRMRLGFSADLPIWFEEGQATVLEDWDFAKPLDENIHAIPNRGRYAPVIRRIYGTERRKDFEGIWSINAAQWGQELPTDQGPLNYCQAWSLTASMIQSKKGRKSLRRIFDSCIGNNRQWNRAIDERERGRLKQHLDAWVPNKLPRDGRVPYESLHLLRQNYKPEVVSRLEPYSDSQEDQIERARQLRRETQERDKKVKFFS